MSTESPTLRRLTRFPGRIQTLDDSEDEKIINKRGTRFPGGIRQDFALLTSAKLQFQGVDSRSLVQVPERIPLLASANNSIIPRHSVPVVDQLVSSIQQEDPWDTHKALRRLKHGSQIHVASTRLIPIRIVTVKEVKGLSNLDELVNIRHPNLLIFEVYEYDNKTTVVSEYAQVTLMQAIAIPYELEQTHISTVFEGMLYLSGHGFSHHNLDSSKVLLQHDGSVKIAYVESCQKTEFTEARQLGLLVLEMIQKCVIPEDIKEGGKLVPISPERWTAELINFLDITSYCSLSEIRMARCQQAPTSYTC